MTSDEIKSLQNSYDEQFRQKPLENLEKELALAIKMFKENLAEKGKVLMRPARHQTGAFTPPAQSREIEIYSDNELLANLQFQWLGQSELEKTILKIISLRKNVTEKRAAKIQEIEKALNLGSNLPLQQMTELQFLQFVDEIRTQCRECIFLISKYSNKDGPGVFDALNIMLNWQTHKNELDSFLKNHPAYRMRPEIAILENLEFIDFRSAHLALEGWLNHVYLEELQLENNHPPSLEQLKHLKITIEILFPLMNFSILKELQNEIPVHITDLISK